MSGARWRPGVVAAAIALLALAAPARGQNASGPRRFVGNFIGATLGAAAGWGAGYIFVKGSGNKFQSTSVTSGEGATNFAVAGSLGAVLLGTFGSRVGAVAVGAPRGSYPARLLASALGWGASVLVGYAAYGRTHDPSPAAILGTVTITQGLVTALLAPRH